MALVGLPVRACPTPPLSPESPASLAAGCSPLPALLDSARAKREGTDISSPCGLTSQSVSRRKRRKASDPVPETPGHRPAIAEIPPPETQQTTASVNHPNVAFCNRADPAGRCSDVLPGSLDAFSSEHLDNLVRSHMTTVCGLESQPVFMNSLGPSNQVSLLHDRKHTNGALQPDWEPTGAGLFSTSGAIRRADGGRECPGSVVADPTPGLYDTGRSGWARTETGEGVSLQVCQASF